MASKVLGKHFILELKGCCPKQLNEVFVVEEAAKKAASVLAFPVLNSSFHRIHPQGVSGNVMTTYAQLSVRTWVSYGYAAVDLLTTSETDNARASLESLKEHFKAQNSSIVEMSQGSTDVIEKLDDAVVEEGINKPAKDCTPNLWISDKDDHSVLSLEMKGPILYDKQSPFQRVQVVDTVKYGKTLVIDGAFQITEGDEYHYHEMIAHPAMFTHGNAKNVLIIGGGDGGSAREVLRHPGLESCVQVEIDAAVVEACKEHIPVTADAYKHPKMNLIIGDGIQYVKEAKDASFDVVIVDGCDPVGPAQGLFSVEFYTNVYRILKEKGVLVTQGEAPRCNERAFLGLNRAFRDIFGEDKAFVCAWYTATYPTGLWTFQGGVKGDVNPSKVQDEEMINKFADEQQLRYYDYGIHHASFAHPRFLKKMLAENIKPLK